MSADQLLVYRGLPTLSRFFALFRHPCEFPPTPIIIYPRTCLAHLQLCHLFIGVSTTFSKRQSRCIRTSFRTIYFITITITRYIVIVMYTAMVFYSVYCTTPHRGRPAERTLRCLKRTKYYNEHLHYPPSRANVGCVYIIIAL